MTTGSKTAHPDAGEPVEACDSGVGGRRRRSKRTAQGRHEPKGRPRGPAVDARRVLASVRAARHSGAIARWAADQVIEAFSGQASPPRPIETDGATEQPALAAVLHVTAELRAIAERADARVARLLTASVDGVTVEDLTDEDDNDDTDDDAEQNSQKTEDSPPHRRGARD